MGSSVVRRALRRDWVSVVSGVTAEKEAGPRRSPTNTFIVLCETARCGYAHGSKGRRVRMSDTDVIANQKLIVENQAKILANQETIKQNQATLETIVKNQERILALLQK